MFDYLQMYLDMTSKCNLNCNFCFHKKDKTNLNIKKGLERISYLNKFKKSRLIIFGGEPLLLQKECVLYLKTYLKQNQNNKKVTIVTNGTLKINEEYLNSKDFSYQVSIYKEVFDKQKEFIENKKIDTYLHLLITKSNINDFNFLIEVLNLKKDIWLSLDRFINESLTLKEIDDFFTFLNNNKKIIKNLDYLFLKNIKKFPGKECMHLNKTGIYIDENNNEKFCSFLKKEIDLNNKCENCNNYLCRACKCDILNNEQREINCYFYKKVKEFYD